VTFPTGASAFEELLRQLQESLALAAAADQTADQLLEREQTLRKAARARVEELEERLAEALRALEADKIPSGQAPHRPRLENSNNPAKRARAAEAEALVRLHPNLSDREISRRAGVHRDVVKRLRRELVGVAEKVVDNPSETATGGRKGFR
jgi:hypothetical protein